MCPSPRESSSFSVLFAIFERNARNQNSKPPAIMLVDTVSQNTDASLQLALAGHGDLQFVRRWGHEGASDQWTEGE